MIDRLQRKFIIIIMLLVSILLSVILCSTCIFLYFNLKTQMNTSLKNAVSFIESWEESDDNPNPETPYEKILDDKKNQKMVKPSEIKKLEYAMAYSSISVISYDTKTKKMDIKLNYSSMSEKILRKTAEKVAESKKQSGIVKSTNLFYYSTEYENGIFVAFTRTDTIIATLTRYIILILCAEGIALVIIFFTSIYLSKLAMEPIKKVMNEQKRFIADASHELKTPLTVIMANNSILYSHPETLVKSQMNWIESTNEEIRHMSRLINDMLILAKSESGMIEKDFEPVNFSDIVMGTVLQFEALAYEREITIKDEIDENIIIFGNEMLLKQLVMSFLDNAVKYEEERGEIRVSLHKKKEKVKFEVQNSKTYMDEEAVSHVFDRFYRAENAKKNMESFGLGLSIAQSIVKRHNGQIYVSSNEKEGTSFWVLF